ncbi:hypothetical protein F8M41_013642 [Gigaspora margarita]|uniref:Uncharacterized protein n=1 Tax=Gigaspora margarita TaxID=4874 RepID=A0A8H3ZYP6_GIGMA|nr:hypothetical protein F8M41_013642 [Gigaspora margarita]
MVSSKSLFVRRNIMTIRMSMMNSDDSSDVSSFNQDFMPQFGFFFRKLCRRLGLAPFCQRLIPKAAFRRAADGGYSSCSIISVPQYRLATRQKNL